MNEDAKEVLEMVLEAWKNGRLVTMYELTSDTFKENYSFTDFKKKLPCTQIASYMLSGKEKQMKNLPVIDFEVTIACKESDMIATGPSRIICEKGAYMPSEFGSWGWCPNVNLIQVHAFKAGKVLGEPEISKHFKTKQGCPGYIRQCLRCPGVRIAKVQTEGRPVELYLGKE